MKKALLAGVLASVAIPAHAGPILEGILPPDVTWEAANDDIESNAERYRDIVLRGGGKTATLETLELGVHGGELLVEAGNTKIVSARGAVATFSSMDLTADRAAATRAFQRLDLSEGPDVDPGSSDICEDADIPFRMEVSGMNLIDPDHGDVSMDKVHVSHDITTPEAGCILELAADASGITLVAKGADVDIGRIDLELHSPVLMSGNTSSEFSRTLLNDLQIKDIKVGYAGSPQAVIRNISAMMNVPSMFLASLSEVMFQVPAGLAADENGNPHADSGNAEKWNDLRAVDLESGVSIDGVEIVGDMPGLLLGREILEKGRRFDAHLGFEKARENIDFFLEADSPYFFDIAVGGQAVMANIPDTQTTRPLSVIMPLAISAIDVKVVDEGLGEAIESDIGLDIYGLARSTVSGFFGSTKADLLASWLDGARLGGAVFSANPEEPVSIMEAFGGLFGDWSTFGDRIEAETGRR